MDLRADGADADAAERRRIVQSSFGVDLDEVPPALPQAWVPAWVEDTKAFAADRVEHRRELATLARVWAALPPGVDPFDALLEAPAPTHAFWVHYAEGGHTVEQDLLLADFVGALWNIDPATTVRVSTAAMYGSAPAAQIVDGRPGDSEPITCPQCGWTGIVGEANTDYFRDVWHRECPRCEKILMIMSMYID